MPRHDDRPPGCPAAVRVGPYTYTIDAVRGLDDLGVTNADNATIRFDPDRPPEKLRSTVLHEVLHAVHHAAAIREPDEKVTAEQFVRRIEPWLLLVLRDNPELVAYLTAPDG